MQELASKMGEMVNKHGDWELADERCKGVRCEGENTIDFDYYKTLEVLELVKR